MATALEDQASATAGPIVLCCARDGRTRLGPVVERLAAEGHQVEVVSDIDAAAQGLLATVDRRGASALYVLFESRLLPMDRLGTLQMKLRTRGVPGDRVRITGLNETPSALSGALGPGAPRRGPPPAPPPRVLPASPPPLDRSGSRPIAPPDPRPDGSSIMEDFTALGSIKATWRRTIGRSPLTLASALGVLVLVGAGTTVAFAMRGDDAAAQSDDPAAQVLAQAERDASGPEKTNALETTPTAPSAEPEPEPEPEAVADPASPVDPVAVDAGAQAPDAEGGEPADPSTATALPQAEAGEAELLEEIPEDGQAVDDSDAVYRALSERKVRALDILLVAPEPVKKRRRRTRLHRMSWEDGSRYCAELDIEGVGGWRLPSIGELSSLTKGRMLGDGKFWSATKADTFGQSRVVWNSRKAKMGPAPTNWKGGRVVCVRKTIRTPDGPDTDR